eukprot:TRINITY_DN7844_c0_g1_i1.p2 TRINITY_DN7844_c0_g1~~TRINITY_DN7844_c0_g1_i1.p2  ORF type:complete len:117 (-),score=31.79 TRINITY_DN7844_c0_g1_i1:100-450(-)
MDGSADANAAEQFPLLAAILEERDITDMTPSVVSQKLGEMNREDVEELAQQLFVVLKQTEGQLEELRQGAKAMGRGGRGMTRARSHEAATFQRAGPGMSRGGRSGPVGTAQGRRMP